MIEFLSLNQFSESEILNTHNDAFSDYEVPMQLSLEVFRYFNRRRGVRYDLSIGAVEGKRLIGFILNAVDFWNGKLTAYDCGTGVIPEFRQKGIANQIFSELLPHLRVEKVEQYLLEVIQTNTAAVKLYKKRKFLITREFDCLVVEKKKLAEIFQNDQKMVLSIIYDIRDIETIDWKMAKRFWNFSPSWQNSDSSIQRVNDSFHYLGAFYQKELVGYIVLEQHGGVTQIAVHPKHRNRYIGANLLKRVIEKFLNVEKFNIINVDTQNTKLLNFLQKFGFQTFTTQYEMILEL